MKPNIHLANALVRMLVIARILEKDADYFLKQVNDSGLKNALKRLKDASISNLNGVVERYDTESQQRLKKHLGEDKVASIHAILERLVLMNGPQLAEMEEHIIKLTTVKEPDLVTEKEGV